MPTSEKSADELLRDELLDVRKRRNYHGRRDRNRNGDSLATGETPENLTGLALSGGGIRAAAFSLGFLQAMYSTGRMKAFDFLSTVSGGGYAGGMFSATVVNHKGDVNWERNGRYGRLDLETLPDGSQPDSVKRLGLYGRLMSDFVRLFSRHLWGFLVNITIAISGLITVAALLAYLMRIPWNRGMMPVLNELGFQNDVSTSFFCTFLAFLVWLGSHLIRRIAKAFKKKSAPITQYSYLLLLASFVLCLLTMLAIGDIDLGNMFASNSSNEKIEKSINRLVQWMGVAISGLFATSLLPYLSPKRLLQSGQPNASRVQSVIFRAAANALVIGAPLVIFFFLVHEDISHHNSDRPDSDQLTRPHLSNPLGFANKLESQATSLVSERKQLARNIYNVLNKSKFVEADFRSSKVEIGSDLAQIRTLSEQKGVSDAELGFGGRLLQWLANATHVNDRFGKRVEDLKLSGTHKDQIVRRFNEKILSNPSLFVAFEKDIKQGKEQESSQRDTQSGEAGNAAALDIKQVEEQESSQRVAQPGDAGKAAAKDIGPKVTPIDSSQQLLRKFGLPVSVAISSQDNHLEVALEALGSTQRQWKTRYLAKLKNVQNKALPNDDSKDTEKWDYALMALASEQMDATPGSNQLANSIKDKDDDHVINGSVVTALDTILEDKDKRLKQRLDSKLRLLKLEVDLQANADKYEKWKGKHAAAVGELSRKVRENNWVLLSEIYPHHVRPKNTVFAYAVNEADQMYRLRLAGYAALIFLAVGLISSLNRTSLHGVYRDQLADTWLPNPHLLLHELETCGKGGPLHLINATVNRMGHRRDPDVEGRSRFLLSQRYCGTNKVGYRETSEYSRNDISLADAMAVSGGAVTAVNAPTLLHQFILFITNFRLGQWLPNPQMVDRDHYWPSPIRTILNLLWLPAQRSYLFISDGGHIDNTGLASLLQRRCRLMVCVDASHDPQYEFASLLCVLHGARAKYGITTEAFDPYEKGLDATNILDQLRPGEHERSKAHFVCFRMKYPEIEEPALLIYCKLALTGTEPIELVELARAPGHFPHDPTSDQFLPPQIFESYLALGRHVGETLDDAVSKGLADAFNVGQGWHSGDEPARGDVPADTTEADQDLLQDQRQALLVRAQKTLAEAEFDQAGVDAAVEVLKDWCNLELREAESADGIDPSVLEVVSPWAQEYGPSATRKLRQKFCGVLIDHVDTFATMIAAEPTLRSHYENCFKSLGSGVPFISRALKKLSPPEAETEPA